MLNTEEFLEWLNKEGLQSYVDKNYLYFKSLLNKCFVPKSKENILIFTDLGFPARRIAPLLAANYYSAAKGLGHDAKIIVQNPKFGGELADENVRKALIDAPDGSILLLAFSGKLGFLQKNKMSFRSFIKENKHHFASTIGLQGLDTKMIEKLVPMFTIDYEQLQDKASKLKKVLEGAKTMSVKTASGTDLNLELDNNPMSVVDGSFSSPASGGNLPAGEIYFPPITSSVNGVVVVDGSVKVSDGTLKIKNPITLTIKNGSVIKISGQEEARKFRETIDKAVKNNGEDARVVGEFGIGLNPAAKIIGAMIADEKTLGSAHIGIGSNYWFGGSINIKTHLDAVFLNPQIFIDGEELTIIKNGLQASNTNSQ
ncbi:aminopeptidase [Candidatus Woesearchaeota archaeon]|nr:aminopeptidase [Candidatus Woesearchaeota archaeon]